jgi:hypothetical protein
MQLRMAMIKLESRPAPLAESSAVPTLAKQRTIPVKDLERSRRNGGASTPATSTPT